MRRGSTAGARKHALSSRGGGAERRPSERIGFQAGSSSVRDLARHADFERVMSGICAFFFLLGVMKKRSSRISCGSVEWYDAAPCGPRAYAVRNASTVAFEQSGTSWRGWIYIPDACRSRRARGSSPPRINLIASIHAPGMIPNDGDRKQRFDARSRSRRAACSGVPARRPGIKSKVREVAQDRAAPRMNSRGPAAAQGPQARDLAAKSATGSLSTEMAPTDRKCDVATRTAPRCGLRSEFWHGRLAWSDGHRGLCAR